VWHPPCGFLRFPLGTGKAPPRSWTPRSFASCAVKPSSNHGTTTQYSRGAIQGLTVGAPINEDANAASGSSGGSSLDRQIVHRHSIKPNRNIPVVTSLSRFIKGIFEFFPVSPLCFQTVINDRSVTPLQGFLIFSPLPVSAVFSTGPALASSSCRTCCSTKSCASYLALLAKFQLAVPPSTCPALLWIAYPWQLTRI